LVFYDIKSQPLLISCPPVQQLPNTARPKPTEIADVTAKVEPNWLRTWIFTNSHRITKSEIRKILCDSGGVVHWVFYGVQREKELSQNYSLTDRGIIKVRSRLIMTDHWIGHINHAGHDYS